MTGARRGYVLALICFSFFLNYADRQILGALIEPVKQEFGLSDLELGLMTGLGFGVFYSVCSLPLARLADRWNRRNVLLICLALWSGATMLSGAVVTSAQLVAARLVVGIGEAGGGPSSIAMISDLFSARRRGTAIACYNAAGALGGAFALAAGAWIATHYGWRIAFIIIGLPGVFLALLIVLTVAEPERAGGARVQATFRETMAQILGQRVLVLAMLGGAASSAAITCLSWITPFFQRSHGLSLVDAGSMVGLAILFMAPLGQFLGGFISDRYGVRSRSAMMGILAVINLLAAGSASAMVLASSTTAAIVAFYIWISLAQSYPPPVFALSQSLVPAHMRATSQAVVGMAFNLVGSGVGPTATGALSSMLEHSYGQESLRYALLVVCCTMSVLAAMFYFAAARAAAGAARSRIGEETSIVQQEGI